MRPGASHAGGARAVLVRDVLAREAGHSGTARAAPARIAQLGREECARRLMNLGPAIAARIRSAAGHGILVATAAIVSPSSLAIALHPSAGVPVRIRTRIGNVGC